jgi:formamidopyrimidine-DNA glycosylase
MEPHPWRGYIDILANLVVTMPELPDVELFRRLAECHSVGQVVAKVEVLDTGSLQGATPATLQRRLKDRTLRSARRHGKVLLLETDDSAALAFHFGTNGSLQYVTHGGPEPRFARVCLDFAKGDRLAYLNPRRIGNAHFAPNASAFIKDERLGPDVLEPSFDLAAFTAALAGRRQVIKAVLMDQSRMAGIGNIYADEILFQARLHPATPTNLLDKATISRLFDAMKSVLQTAVDCGAGAENFTDRLPKGFLLPERHLGGHCPRCGTAIEQEKRGGRSGYFCPRCQPAPRT